MSFTAWLVHYKATLLKVSVSPESVTQRSCLQFSNCNQRKTRVMLVFMTCCLAALINKSTTFSFPVTLMNPGLDRAHEQKTRISEVVQNCCSMSVSSTCGKLSLLDPFITFALQSSFSLSSSLRRKTGTILGRCGGWEVQRQGNCAKMYPARGSWGKGAELVPRLCCQTLLSWQEKQTSAITVRIILRSFEQAKQSLEEREIRVLRISWSSRRDFTN